MYKNQKMPTFSVILPKCVSRGKYLNIDKSDSDTFNT